MQIYEDLHEMGYPTGWEDVFAEADHGILNACTIVEKDGIESTPVSTKVFDAYRACPPDEVRVVIVGQNPYHIKGYAEGLSFSCSTGQTPKSLSNIYKELTNTIPGFVAPQNGDLRPWTKRGVMLLNVSLVTKVGSADYKQHIWMPLIKKTIDRLKADGRVIWLLWGNFAQKLGTEIGLACKQLKAAHPSPLAGNKFLGCGHFREVNRILVSRGEEPVDWNLVPSESKDI